MGAKAVRGTRLCWREAVLEAVSGTESDPAARSSLLEGAVEALRTEFSEKETGATGSAYRAYCVALESLAALERWEGDTLAARPDAERHLRAARHKADLESAGLDREDPLLGPLQGVLAEIAGIGSLGQIASARRRLARVALPIRIIEDAQTPPRGPRSEDESNANAPRPRAAVISSLDGAPLTGAHLVTPNRVHQLTVEARVLEWPAGKPRLTLRFLSRWPVSTIDVTEIELQRPIEEIDGLRIAEGTGHLTLSATAADPSEILVLMVEGQLSGEDGSQTIALLGHPRIELRTFDPAADVSTGAPTLDLRIAEMLAELRKEGIAPAEEQAFGRFLGAIAKAGAQIQADREFPQDSDPVEADLQREMRKRLKMASELGGRLVEHGWQGGGETDLSHDGVIAELKLAKKKSVTVETAKNYLGQTTQYASAGGRQLSILVILDMTPKEAPPGVLANEIEWLVPAGSRLSDGAYPSKVAVVLLRGNLPPPSAWS